MLRVRRALRVAGSSSQSATKLLLALLEEGIGTAVASRGRSVLHSRDERSDGFIGEATDEGVGCVARQRQVDHLGGVPEERADRGEKCLGVRLRGLQPPVTAYS